MRSDCVDCEYKRALANWAVHRNKFITRTLPKYYIGGVITSALGFCTAHYIAGLPLGAHLLLPILIFGLIIASPLAKVSEYQAKPSRSDIHAIVMLRKLVAQAKD